MYKEFKRHKSRIRYNEEDTKATVSTYDHQLQIDLECLGIKPIDRNPFGLRVYALPKWYILLPIRNINYHKQNRNRRQISPE